MPDVIWKKKAVKQLRKIDTRYQATIVTKITMLSDFPLVELDIVKLSGCDDSYRLRVGDYRILFDRIDGEPVIISIEAILKRDDKTYS